MNYLNEVNLSGLVHHLNRKKNGSEYFEFAIRHENLWTDGTTRKDFLSARAFPEEIRAKLKAMPENTPVKIKGILRSSKGSGELYIEVIEVQELPELGQLENFVRLEGFFHNIKAQSEGETGTGKYIRFAVKQENSNYGRDFIVVRTYNENLRTKLSDMNDSDPVSVEGTLRSSKGSGVNYVRCTNIWKLTNSKRESE